MSIPDRFRLLSPVSASKTIEGVDYVFYTCSVGLLASLAPTLAKLVSQFMTLLAKDEDDRGYTEENYSSGEGQTREFINKTTYEPVSAERAKLRAEQREAAIEKALSEVLHDKNRTAVARLIMNSLRDDFDRKVKLNDQQARDFADEMDAPVFVQFVMGMATANARVFGDLGKALGRAVQKQAVGLLGANEAPEASGTAG